MLVNRNDRDMLGEGRLHEGKICIFVVAFWLVLLRFHNALSHAVTPTCCVYAEMEVKCNSKSIFGPLN